MAHGGVVLAGVDGTDSGRAALRTAAGEAVSAGVRLVALHVRRSPRPLELMAWETYPIAEQWRDELDGFRELRRKYLIYPESTK